MGEKRGKSRPKQTPNPAKKAAVEGVATSEQAPDLDEVALFPSFEDLPQHSTARPYRQATILQLQRRYGNGYVQRLIARRQAEGGTGPTEEEKATAQAAAASAESAASQVASLGQQEAAKSKEKKGQEKQKGEVAKQKASQEKGEKKREPGKNGAGIKPGQTKPSSETGAQVPEEDLGAEMVGPAVNGTGSEAKAPSSPEEDPGFQKAKALIKKEAGKKKKHESAGQKAGQAQEAAESPGSELEAKAQANQVGEMEQAEAPSFDAAGFKAQLMQRIQALAPKSAQEADQFKQSNKVGSLKNEMKAKVTQETGKSERPLEEKSAEAPDTGAVEPKQVTPLKESPSASPPGDVAAHQAVPKAKGQAEVEAPFQEDSKKLDQQMADADITEEQLEESNEPEFLTALEAKKGAQEHAKGAPAEFRQAEQEQISQAQEEASAVAQEKTQSMHGDREQMLGQVGNEQTQTKSEDEKKRQEVAGHIQKIYQRTKTNVEKKLGDLDSKVDQTFDQGAEVAKQAFENYVDAKMEAYKERRYGGMLGWARWAKDKLLGMPSEVNSFYQQGRQLFLQNMDAVIDNVVTIIGTAIAEAKAEIVKGRQEIQDYVNQLPAELQQVGQNAAERIQGKFDQLEQNVEAKQNELIDHLAQKYLENLQALDARIEELKAANQGLVQQAFGAIGGVIKTILKLKDMFLSVLGKAASAIKDILKNPIGFLSNLISGVKKGLQNFVGNIGKHLKKGLMSWLFGALAEAGIHLPESFDLKGILSLVLQVLGLTWENLRAKAVKLFGEKIVAGLEKVFTVFKALKEQGIAGLWEFVKDRLSTLKDTIFDAIKDLIVTQVIKAGIQWLVGILGGPAGAFIKAAKAIYDIIMWFVTKGQQVASLVQAIIQSITAIAGGALGQAANFIEQSLAKAIPVVISFLASLLGLGGLSEKIKGIIKKVQAPVNQAIDWILDKARSLVGKVGRMLGVGGKDQPGQEKEYTDKDRQAAVNSIKVEEKKYAQNGSISKENARKAAASAKQKHPVLKTVQVVDGGDSWDYDYVFRESLVTKIKKLFGRDAKSKVQKEIRRRAGEFQNQCDRAIAKYHGEHGAATREISAIYDRLKPEMRAQQIRTSNLPGFLNDLKELSESERNQLADEYLNQINKIYHDRKLTAAQTGVRVVKPEPGTGYGARPLPGPPVKKPRGGGGLGSDEFF